MSEYHFPVPGSANEKDIVILVRRHWVSFLGQFLLGILLLLLPIIAIIVTYSINRQVFRGVVIDFIVLLLSAYYLIAITYCFIAWISFYYNLYIITHTEIIEIEQIGFFGREIAQMPLLRVQDVTSRIKGFLPTVFAYGDVLVETASEQKEPFVLCAIPNPQEVANRVIELHDEVIETEGRHHQVLEGEGTLAPGLIGEEKNSELPTPPEKEEPEDEGEVSKDDLDKGGEIDIK